MRRLAASLALLLATTAHALPITRAAGWGRCSAANGRLLTVAPWGLGCRADGTLLIAESTGGNDVCALNPDRSAQPFAGTARKGFSGDGGAAVDAQLSAPLDVAVDLMDVYITEGTRLRVVQGGGTISTAVSGLNFPAGVAVCPDDKLVVAEQGANRIVRYNLPCYGPGTCGPGVVLAGTGVGSYTGDGGPAVNATLNAPADVACGPDGSVYVADFNNGVIRKISPAGTISTVAGRKGASALGDGGPATDARLVLPRGVALLPDGRLVIADSTQHRVRIVATDGTISTLVGNGNQNALQLETGDTATQEIPYPTQLQVCGGTLYVSSDKPGLTQGVVFAIDLGATPPTVTPVASTPTRTVTRTPTLSPTRTATLTPLPTCNAPCVP